MAPHKVTKIKAVEVLQLFCTFHCICERLREIIHEYVFYTSSAKGRPLSVKRGILST